jgi:tRNA 5-methylaminomethyl-2-thiouridine biosynthesis bifunctional protein
MSSLKRPYAELEWTENGPVATATGDVYFSAENGLEETRSVFLKGAGFPQRFNQDLAIVAELGFGTGLNFLALWQSFVEHAPSNARLHFVSIEGFPMRREDAERALSAFPEISRLSKALIDQWPSPHIGPHRLIFDGGRVTLTVFHDTVEAALKQMDFQADAWFLDGFAPAKNPDMWDTNLYAEIARLTKPGAPAASFTVAGHVRRGLAEVGFEVSKQPGFGRKRERMEAIFAGSPRTKSITPFPAAQSIDGPVAIIGGGIAAASLVEALKRRNREVSVFAEGGWASGASSAPKGLLTARLGLQDQPKTRVFHNAFDYASRLYQNHEVFTQTGLITLASNVDERARFERLVAALDEGFELLNAQQASERADETVSGAMWSARAGQFDASALVNALHDGQAAIDCQITQIETGESGVALRDANGKHVFQGAAIIYAGGAYGSDLLADALNMKPVSGRVGVYEASQPPSKPIDGFGYLVPDTEQIVLGSTHVRDFESGTPQDADPVLRETLKAALPELSSRLDDQTNSWAGVRASTPDHDPVFGVLPTKDYASVWEKPAKGGARYPEHSACDRRVLCLTGLGGRGFTHAPLLAESLVSRLCGEPDAVQVNAVEALHPARFLWRALKRG